MPYPEWLERRVKQQISVDFHNGMLRFLLEESLQTGYISPVSIAALHQYLDWTKLSNPDKPMSDGVIRGEPILDPASIDFKDFLSDLTSDSTKEIDNNLLIEWITEELEKLRKNDLIQ